MVLLTRPTLVLLCTSASWGGLEQSVARLGQWLKDEGVTVHILCCVGTPLYAQAERQGQAVAWSRSAKYFDFLAAGRLKSKMAAWGNPPLVIPHNRDLDVAAWAHRLGWGRFALWYWQHMQLGVAKKGFFQRMRYTRLTGWLTSLEWLRKEVLEKTTVPAEKIHIVPAGVELEKFQVDLGSREMIRRNLGLPLDFPILGLIGRLDPRKGQSEAIEALKGLPENVHLALMGEATRDALGCDYGAVLLEQVRKAGLEHRVHFLPFSSDPAPFYKAVDVVLMLTEGETYGLVTVEALASGTPVIGSRSGGTIELLGHGAYGSLVETGDMMGLRKTILDVLADPGSAAEKMHVGQAYLWKEASHHVVVERFKDLVLEIS